jgi:hypothetical protein
MPLFERYIGIEYSGAKTPESSLFGLRIYVADSTNPPHAVEPPPSTRTHWTRRGAAEWLCKELAKDIPAIVGIAHAFSFPVEYFEKFSLPLDWPKFLDDFQKHWPTDDSSTDVDSVRYGSCGQGSQRMGDVRWLRLTERCTVNTKSVFHFDVQDSVAKATHAGLPWQRYLRHECKRSIHFWPFDGWNVPYGSSVVAEVYPSLWTRRFASGSRNGNSQAAFAVAAWLHRVDVNRSLPHFLNPPLEPEERRIAAIEGWILGMG